MGNISYADKLKKIATAVYILKENETVKVQYTPKNPKITKATMESVIQCFGSGSGFRGLLDPDLPNRDQEA